MTDDDVVGKMFLVKSFEARYREIGPAHDPAAPSQHMVTLQIVSEVGESTNVMASPLMFLNPKIAKELGQRLIREANSASESSRAPIQKKPH
jgi:hypothetical protein